MIQPSRPPAPRPGDSLPAAPAPGRPAVLDSIPPTSELRAAMARQVEAFVARVAVVGALRPRPIPERWLLKASSSAMTLVEVLIVVVILGIIAALAIPEWARANANAKESSLATDLQTARKQIEVYRSQHGGRSPHLDENGKPDTANFVNRLTRKTDAQGKLGGGSLGPYLTEWPTNPFGPSSAGSMVTFGTASAPPRDGTSGWYYSTTSCLLSANTSSGGRFYDPPVDTSATRRR